MRQKQIKQKTISVFKTISARSYVEAHLYEVPWAGKD